MTDASLAPAGWYADNADPDLLRYWDGAAWTERSLPASYRHHEPNEYVQLLRESWQYLRWTLQVALVAYMVHALLVDQWPAEFEGTSVVTLFVVVSLLRPEARNSWESRCTTAESWTMVGILVAGTMRNGGWLPGLVSAALVVTLAVAVRRDERPPRWLWITVEIVLLLAALTICLPYLLSADPSWRLL